MIRRPHPMAVTALVTLTAAILSCAPATAGAAERGIVGRPAPELAVDTWFNLPGDTDALRLAELRGKVIYLYFFQAWCPGCHSHGFPTLEAVHEHFAGDDDIVFVAVQTAFEGLHTNTAQRAQKTVAKYGLTIPVGHAAGAGEHRSPAIMRAYRSGGTPWTVIIDRDGIVRFDGFKIDARPAIDLIDRLTTAPSGE